jgi:vancomycin resistance protein YoaR
MKSLVTEVKKIILEEVYQYKLDTINESMIQDFLALLLSSKVRRDLKKYKNTAEYKELERQIEINKKTMETLAAKLEKHAETRNALIKDAKKLGINVKDTMTYDDIVAAFPDHATEMNRIRRKYSNK